MPNADAGDFYYVDGNDCDDVAGDTHGDDDSSRQEHPGNSKPFGDSRWAWGHRGPHAQGFDNDDDEEEEDGYDDDDDYIQKVIGQKTLIQLHQ